MVYLRLHGKKAVLRIPALPDHDVCYFSLNLRIYVLIIWVDELYGLFAYLGSCRKRSAATTNTNASKRTRWSKYKEYDSDNSSDYDPHPPSDGGDSDEPAPINVKIEVEEDAVLPDSPNNGSDFDFECVDGKKLRNSDFAQ